MKSTTTLSIDEAIGRLCRRWLQVAEGIADAGSGRRSGLSAGSTADGHSWVEGLLPTVREVTGALSAQWVCQSGPRWVTAASSGSDRPFLNNSVAESLVADAAESAAAVRRSGWIAVAVDRGDRALDGQADAPSPPTVLLLGLAEESAEPAAGERAPLMPLVEQVAVLLGTFERLQLQLSSGAATTAQLRYLLDCSIRWASIEDTEELLHGIAAAAIELLNAERASIFLWDKRRGKLIGRPALGVEGGKLEVDDKAGIVGAVLSAGKPQLWTAGDDAESEVNRSVDRRLKFVTRSLVAVPLRSPTGQLLGVFEVINRIGDAATKPDPAIGFDAADVSKLSDLARHAAAAIQGTQTLQRLTRTRDRLLNDAASNCRVIGNSPAIRNLRETIQRVAPTDLAVLALGENGTGKEVVARSLHFQSHRRDEPFVAVNCAALVESLLESELFGHERGAFTDAHQARAGKFEMAGGGTLFLDEIGDMSPGGQAKLLRVLEDKTVIRVGGSTPISVDVRIIAATNQSLPDLVAAKRFREDLFFRLNVVAFRLPPLRERGNDIVLLAEHFLEQFAEQIGRTCPRLSSEAREALLRYRWPGNVRELRNVMERASYLAQSDVLSEADLGLSLSDSIPMIGSGYSGEASSPQDETLAEATRRFQTRHIEAAIDQHKRNMTAAAKALGLHRSNLYRKMRQLEMNLDDLDE